MIEVAVDSLAKDRVVKSRIYAAAGIPEYWLVDAASFCAETYTDPEPRAQRYASLQTLRGDGELCPRCARIDPLRIDALFA